MAIILRTMGKHRNKKVFRTSNSRLHPQSKKQAQTKDSDMNGILQKIMNCLGYTPNKNQAVPCAKEAVIYKSELEYIKKCILEYPHIETGGQLFGFWTPQGRPVVLYAIGPGPCAGHHNAFFEQDIEYLDLVGNAIVKNFGLCHIGEWHSHHQLGLAQPSGHDASNIQSNVDRLKLNHFLLCIGNCNEREAALNPFMFYQGARQYLKVLWNEVVIDSPFRVIIDNALKNVLVHPHTHNIATSHEVTFNQIQSPRQKKYDEGYWLNDKENGLVLKNIVDYVKECNYGCRVEVKLENITKYVHIIVSSYGKVDQDIIFDKEFPNSPPRIIYNDIYFNLGNTKDISKISYWNYSGDILSSFKNYYIHIR